MRKLNKSITVSLIIIIIVVTTFLMKGELVIQQSQNESLIDNGILLLISIYFALSYLFEEKSSLFKIGIWICTNVFWPNSKKWALVISLVLLVSSITLMF